MHEHQKLLFSRLFLAPVGLHGYFICPWHRYMQRTSQMCAVTGTARWSNWPIGYRYRSLKAAQSIWFTWCKIYDFMWAALLVRQYLQGRRLLVCTDHSSMKGILPFPIQLPCWRHGEQDFGVWLRVIHGVRIKNLTAEVLSRLGTTGIDDTQI